MRRSLWIVTIWLVAASALSARAADDDKLAPPAKYATLTTTALRYVRDLPKVTGNTLTILVLHSSDRASKVLATDHANAFRDRAKVKEVLGQVRLRVEQEAYGGPKELRKLLADTKARVVLIEPGLSSSLKEILKEAREVKALTLACRVSYVRAGVGFGVVVVNRRLKMFMSQKACVAAGFRFSSAILKRATIVDRKKE